MLKISKMHGLGNDYIYVDLINSRARGGELDWSSLSRRISDRNEGIGSDGLILILPSEKCDFAARIFNADGSEAKMCGNGIRCVGKYVFDHGHTTKREISVDTLAGPRNLWLFGDKTITSVKVDMGVPQFSESAVPFRPTVTNEMHSDKNFTSLSINWGEETITTMPLSMGNPHSVIFVDTVKSYPVREQGPKIENHPCFPDRVNVEFVEVLNDSELAVRVWERGSGETLACGTGACAAAVASHLNKGTNRKSTVHLHRGSLEIEWNLDEHVYMTGPAIEVFSGILNPDWMTEPSQEE